MPVVAHRTSHEEDPARDPIHVLQLADHLGYAGVLHGAGRLYLNISRRFDPSRVRCTLCVIRPADTLSTRFTQAGVDLVHLGRQKFDPLTLVDVVRLVQRRRVEVIHAHAYGGSTFGRLAAVWAGVPCIVHVHDEDLSYPWYQFLADRVLSGVTTKGIAVSAPVLEAAVRKRAIPRRRIEVVHNGIVLEEFEPRGPAERALIRRELGVAPGVPIVGTLARLREEKGIAYLLEAIPVVLRAVPRVSFVIGGDGPMRGALKASVRRLGIEQHVTFTGYREDVPRLLSVFDVKVVPSPAEPFGSVILEAMAMGKAIVATVGGGTPEMLTDRVTGLLVQPRNSMALARAIIELLRDPRLRSDIGRRAYSASRQYGIDRYVRTLERIYHELVRPYQVGRQAANA